MTMFTKKPSKSLLKRLNYHMSKRTLAEKVKTAKSSQFVGRITCIHYFVLNAVLSANLMLQ